MKATHILAIASLSTLAAFGAHADEYYGSQYAQQIDGQRSRAEVQAEARNPVMISNGGTGVHAVVKSGLDRAEVRAEAAAALRAGEIPQGETGLM
ncbi:MAG: DUF4148 domain-containing protein [Ramlibacter sp.]